MSAQLISEFSPIVTAIGQALVNFVWQGAIIGCLTAILLQLLRNTTPQIRYALSCTALSLCLVLPILTIVSANVDPSATRMIADPLTSSHNNPINHSNLFLLRDWIALHLIGLVTMWAICVGLFSARLTLGLIWVARIANTKTSQAMPLWQRKIDQFAARSGIRRPIALREVSNLTSPAVAGWLRPVILVPASLLSGMPPDLLEALLAHEVAHIRRLDYLVNLLQSAVEILLFYHPAVWWISNQIRIEREKIADDLASELIGEPRRLALALNELERAQFARHQLALAATGGNLLDRIQRLTRPNIQPIGLKAIIPALSLMLISITLYANAAADNATAMPAHTDSTKPLVNLATCKPQYPQLSLANNEQGTVKLSFSIDKTGKVTGSNIKQSSGHPLLDDAALSALKNCSFSPGTENGKAVDAMVSIDYVWKIDN